MHDSASLVSLVAATALTEHMTNLDVKDSTDEGSTAFVLALQRMGDPVKSLWEWLEREPERRNMFAHAMEGVGECDISGRCRGVVNTART